MVNMIIDRKELLEQLKKESPEKAAFLEKFYSASDDERQKMINHALNYFEYIGNKEDEESKQ